jgi:hypothetical protein
MIKEENISKIINRQTFFTSRQVFYSFVPTVGLLSYFIWIDVKYFQNELQNLNTCEVLDNVTIISNLCNNGIPDYSRAYLRFCFYSTIFLPWLFGLIDVYDKINFYNIISCQSIFMTYMSRCMALYALIPLLSYYDYENKTLIINMITFENRMYFLTIGAGVLLAFIVTWTYWYSINWDPQRFINFYESNREQKIKTILFGFVWLLACLIICNSFCFCVATLSNQSVGNFLGFIQPRGPNLTDLSIGTILIVVCSMSEITIIMYIYFYLKNRVPHSSIEMITQLANNQSSSISIEIDCKNG